MKLLNFIVDVIFSVFVVLDNYNNTLYEEYSVPVGSASWLIIG